MLLLPGKHFKIQYGYSLITVTMKYKLWKSVLMQVTWILNMLFIDLKKIKYFFVLYKYKDEQPYLWCKG